MSSSSESDAPETITLKTAKSQSRRQNKELGERQKLAARFKKEKNQARDVRLKAESAGKKSVVPIQIKSTKENERRQKGKSKEHAMGVEEERTRLEQRMERAMAAAEAEEESEDSDDGSDALIREGDENSTAEEESDEGDSEDAGAEVSLNPDYLPEHYFDQIPSSVNPSSIIKQIKSPVVKRRRKVRDRRKQKEKVIGSTVIRKLSSSSLSTVGRTTPSTNAKRFLRRQLRGDIRTKGWERRPVAIGSLASRTRPAVRFVRDRD